ncbi:hypothetical protein I317_07260 [Kwoniella heveanensis CBS 569]|nr:hypothetical protein I317_07260 [Kwoniella heveanensis CBS 569]
MNATVGLGVPGIVTNLSEILGAAQAVAGQPFPKSSKRTYDEYRQSDLAMSDQAGIRTIKRISTIIPPIPIMGQKRVGVLARNFIDAHRPIAGAQITVGEGRYVGREREKETLVDRLCEYMGILVNNSKKRDLRGNDVINPQNGLTQYMSVSTLKSYAYRISHLLPRFAWPSFGHEELQSAKDVIHSFWITLAKLKNLTWTQRRVTTLFAPDMKGLIETIFKVYEGKWDLAVQTAAKFLIFFYTGARPGSVLKTDHYPLEFSVWENVRFRPVRDEQGKIIAYDTYFTLKAFKGFHKERGLECGVFGNRTLEDLRQTDKFEFKCDKEFDKKPIFLAWASRSRLNNEWRALTASAANRVLKDLMIRYGIATHKPFSDTLYAFRRGFATTVGKHLNPAIAKFFLGHAANSTMFERFYNQSNIDENLTEGLLGREEAQERVTTPLSLLRSEEGLEPQKMTLKEALEIHPEFRHLKSKRDLLRLCLRTGSSQWLKVSPYKEMSAKTQLSNACLPLLIGKQESQLRNILTRLRREKLTKDLTLQREADLERTYLEVQSRREEAERPSELAVKLQKILIDQERDMLEDESSPMVDFEHTIDIDPDFDEPLGGEELSNDDEEEEDTAAADIASEAEEDNDGSESLVYEFGEAINDEGGEGTKINARGIELAQRFVEASDVRDAQARGRRPSAAAAQPKSEQGQEQGQGQEQVREQEQEQEQEEAVADPLVDEQLSATEQKKTLLDALVGLANQDLQNPDGAPCSKCAEDPTAGADEKAALWRPRELTRKQRHDIQYHMPFARWHRWFKSHVKEDNRWQCPFCASTFAAQSRRASYNHLDSKHKRLMDPELVAVMQDPAKAKNDVKVAMNSFGWANDRPDTKFNRSTRSEFDRYVVPGSFGILDVADPIRSLLGLGAGLHESLDISYDTSLLSDELFDEEGWLRR